MSKVIIGYAEDSIEENLEELKGEEDTHILLINNKDEIRGVLMTFRDYESIKATLEVLSIPGMLETLEEGKKAIDSGDFNGLISLYED